MSSKVKLPVLLSLTASLLGAGNIYIAAFFYETEVLARYIEFVAYYTLLSSITLSGMVTPILRSWLAGFEGFFKHAVLISGLTGVVVSLLIAVVHLYQPYGLQVSMWLVLGPLLTPLTFCETLLVAQKDFVFPRAVALGMQILMMLGILTTSMTGLAFTDVFLLSRLGYVLFLPTFFAALGYQRFCQSTYVRQGLRQTASNVLLTTSARLDKVIVGQADAASLVGLQFANIIPNAIKTQSKIVTTILNVEWSSQGPHGHRQQLVGIVKRALILIVVLVLTINVVNYVTFFHVLEASVRHIFPASVVFSLTIFPLIGSVFLNQFLNIHTEGRHAVQLQMLRNVLLAASTVLVLKSIMLFAIAVLLVEVLYFLSLLYFVLDLKDENS